MATSTSISTEWSPSSWRNKKVYQQPTYMDPVALDSALAQVQEYPPLVHVSEVELLKTELARVARGEKFLLQGGDCAERFLDCRQKPIEDKIKILLQMSLVMTYVGHMPVVRVARMAGQYAKPRSSNTEVVDGQEVLSFRGDNVNSFSAKDRNPDPQRLISAYFHSSATLNYTRAVLAGGFGNLRNPELWDFEYVKDKALLNEYKTICANILDSLHFFETLESTSAMPESTLRGVNMYTSHEGLLLPYEEALTRPIANYGHTTGASRYKYYNSGAHFLWIGDRTRQLDGAHIEYFSGIANPIGIKVGPTSDPAELVQLVAKLNPTNEAGKITLITRCGAGKVEECLPKFILAIKASGHTVVWSCDPMHGNTNTVNGYKTRKFDDVFSEVIRTLEIHEKLGTILGGVHLEMTGENVTECLGGSGEISQDHLPERYHTYCDPRLNYTQSLDLAFALSKHMKTRREQLHPLI